VLTIANLTVRIGHVMVLRNVSLDAPRGSLIGLFGRNGAGKTSLMRAVMGALPVVQGEIRFRGEPLHDRPGRMRAHLGIGYMPEDRKLVPDLTVDDNIRMPIFAGVAASRERLDWALGLMPEIAGFGARKAIDLSGGQQKLVALARALVAGSRLLLLDEPSEGIAPVLARRLAEVLAQLKGTGLTVLIAESDNRYVVDIVDRIYEIERGEILAA